MRLWLVVALAACSPMDRGPRFRPAGNLSPRAGGTLHLASKDQVRTLDPSIAYDEVSSLPAHAMFDTLVDYEPSSDADPGRGLQLVPRLAERWTVSSDGKVYAFTLRQGLAYSDGAPVVAADIKYSLERALATPESPFGQFLAGVTGAKDVIRGKALHASGIAATDPHTLVIALDSPSPGFLFVMAMTFTTPQRADHVAAAGDQLRRRPLGCGPFALDTWDEGQVLVLRRTPAYYDPSRVHLDAIEQLENVPRDTQFLMFDRGVLDAAERLTAPDYLWLSAQPEWSAYVHTRATMNAYGSRFNVRVKPFDDRRVRQALNYALDKQHTVKLLNGAAVASHGLLPPGMFGRDDTIPPYPHDPAKARALLTEAGYPDGFDAEYLVMNDEEAEKLAGSLRDDLAEVGVRIHIVVESFTTYLTEIGSPDGAAFSKATWIGDYPDPENFLDVRFHSRMIAKQSSNNDTFYANPELDDLLDRARSETDVARRAELYRRAERVLYDDAPWIWDYHQQMTEVTQPYVLGYAPHPVWQRDYTSAWLDLGANGEPVRR